MCQLLSAPQSSSEEPSDVVLSCLIERPPLLRPDMFLDYSVPVVVQSVHGMLSSQNTFIHFSSIYQEKYKNINMITGETPNLFGVK